MPTAADASPNNANPASAQTSTGRAAVGAGPRVLRRILSLDDFEAPARRHIPRPIFGYIVSGAERNASALANRAAFDELAFVPEVLVGTAQRTQKTTIFGRTYDSPFGFSPMGEVEAGGAASLPQFVKDEFDAFLECGILAHGFLGVRCAQCGHEKLVVFSCKLRGICPSLRGGGALPQAQDRHGGNGRRAGSEGGPLNNKLAFMTASQLP